MELFDPSKITTWISLSALAVCLVAYTTNKVLNSKLANSMYKKDAYPLLKSILRYTFYLSLIIVVISGAISAFDSYINNKEKKVAEEITLVNRLFQEWALLNDTDRLTALNAIRLAANRYPSYETHFMLATALLEQRQYEESIRFYDFAIAMNKTKEAYLNKGHALEALGELNKALAVYQQGLNAGSNSLSHNVFQSKLHYGAAQIYLELYQAEKASNPNQDYLDRAKESLTLAKPNALINSGHEVAILNAFGRLHDFAHNEPEAFDYYKKALDLSTLHFWTLPEALQLANSNNNMADLLLQEIFESSEDKIKSFELAAKYSEEAIHIYRNAGFEKGLGYAYYNLAEANRKLDNDVLALNNYKLSKSHFEQSGHIVHLDTVKERIMMMEESNSL